VEGELSLLLEEFLLRGSEAFRSADGRRLGGVWDRRIGGGRYKADDGKGDRVHVRCKLRMKV